MYPLTSRSLATFFITVDETVAEFVVLTAIFKDGTDVFVCVFAAALHWTLS
jgi:hypothetical protein